VSSPLVFRVVKISSPLVVRVIQRLWKVVTWVKTLPRWSFVVSLARQKLPRGKVACLAGDNWWLPCHDRWQRHWSPLWQHWPMLTLSVKSNISIWYV
jgi:hypothetical protein